MKKVWSLCFVLCISLAFVGQASATGRLFHTNEPSSTIEELNPDTGAVINSFPAPETLGDGCSSLAFAYNRLFFQNCGSDIYEINPSTGAVLNSFPSPSLNIDGLGFSGTELYLQDYSSGGLSVATTAGTGSYAGIYGGSSPKVALPASGTIYVLNPNNGALIRTLTLTVPVVGGLSYAGGRNTLFATNADIGTIYEINPATGAIVNSFTSPVPDIFGVGYSFARKTLFLGDVGGPGTIYEVNPDTGTVINTLPVVPNWGLAADENELLLAAPVPTMDEWGMLLFCALAGLASIYYLRRKRKMA
jgi:outer membrane protein assembly factor BamB